MAAIDQRLVVRSWEGILPTDGCTEPSEPLGGLAYENVVNCVMSNSRIFPNLSVHIVSRTGINKVPPSLFIKADR